MFAFLRIGLSAEANGDAAGPNVWAATRDETFRVVWSTVNEAYFDPEFGGVDWAAVGAGYRSELPQVRDNGQLRQHLQRMLHELGRTHFGIVPQEATVFKPEQRGRLGTAGLGVKWLDGRVVIVAAPEGTNAARAGIRAGYTVDEINGFAPQRTAAAMRAAGLSDDIIGRRMAELVLAYLNGPVGDAVRLSASNAAGEATPFDFTLAEHSGQWSEPIGNFPSTPLDCVTRVDSDGIGYLRFSVFAPAVMKDIRSFLRGLKQSNGLIIDLRGNPGGVSAMAPAIAGWLMDREQSMGTMRLRKGGMNLVLYPQEGAFLGPIAVLIDGASASTSEIFAAGLQEFGRARLFGERTAGAALPSAFKALPTGDLFQYAIADLRTPKGASIEGEGVAPDETVRGTLADVSEGRDAAFEAARQWLIKKLGASPELADRKS